MSRLFAIALSLILLAGWVGSQPFRSGRGERCERRFGRRERLTQLSAELDLTAEQQERLRTVVTKCRRAEIEKRADLQTARLDLMEMLGEAEPNRAEIGAKVKQIGEIRTAVALARVDATLETMELLTSEQRAKFRSLGLPARLLLPRRKMKAHPY
jgi:Spy/CpxP family protein refolding chaperone